MAAVTRRRPNVDARAVARCADAHDDVVAKTHDRRARNGFNNSLAPGRRGLRNACIRRRRLTALVEKGEPCAFQVRGSAGMVLVDSSHEAQEQEVIARLPWRIRALRRLVMPVTMASSRKARSGADRRSLIRENRALLRMKASDRPLAPSHNRTARISTSQIRSRTEECKPPENSGELLSESGA